MHSRVFSDVPHSRFSVTLSLTMHNGFLKISLESTNLYFTQVYFIGQCVGLRFSNYGREAGAVNHGKAMAVDPVSDPQ